MRSFSLLSFFLCLHCLESLHVRQTKMDSINSPSCSHSRSRYLTTLVCIMYFIPSTYYHAAVYNRCPQYIIPTPFVIAVITLVIAYKCWQWLFPCNSFQIQYMEFGVLINISHSNYAFKVMACTINKFIELKVSIKWSFLGLCQGL